MAVQQDRRPAIDAAELIRQAKRAKAELQRAASVPVPSRDADVDELEAEALAADAQDELEAIAAVLRREADEDGEEDGQEDEEVPMNYAYLINGGGGDDGGAAEEEADGEEGGEGGDEVNGYWGSTKGECRIFEDHMTSQLSYEEPLPDGCRLHGFLLPDDEAASASASASASACEGMRCWQAELVILDEDQRPWYGPSFGERPEVVGDIQVTLRPGTPAILETRIRVAEEDTDWQSPVSFRRKPPPVVPAAAEGNENLFVFGVGC